MARVLCPYCCKVHDFSKSLECPTFHWQVPPAFVREHDSFPPLWLIAVGFKQYGKTTYLDAATLLLERMDRVLPAMWYEPLDTETFRTIRDIRAATDATRPPTPVAPLRPLLFRVGDMGELGSRCLVLYDVAGESFELPENVGASAPALRLVNTAWFLVSLPNLQEDHPRRTIQELLRVYLSGMDDLRLDVSGSNLIVIYTKADAVRDFPDDLREYLMSDPLTGVARGETLAGSAPELDFRKYLFEMQQVSDRLEEFTRAQVPGGPGFISRARSKGINLVFSLVSALGEKPDARGSLGHEKSPRRVLDPLLWAMTLEQKRTSRTIRLVLDPVRQGEEGLVSEIWSHLAEHGEVTTHVLGQARALSGPGQVPSPLRAGGRSRPRLVGPILQACSPEDRLLVLTDGPIFDLADFRDSEWTGRLLLAATQEEIPLEWEHLETFRSNDDIGYLINRLLSL